MSNQAKNYGKNTVKNVSQYMTYSPVEYKGQLSSSQVKSICNTMKISETTKQIVEHFFNKGLGYTEISKETGQSRQAVYQRLKMVVSSAISKGLI